MSVGSQSRRARPSASESTTDRSGEPEFSSVPEVIDAVARGELVIVVDDADRENEADLIMAASLATPERMGFMIRYTSGIVCAALPAERARQLDLAPMSARNDSPHETAFTVSVDVREGLSTGISPDERSRTVRALCDENAVPDDFVRPGHVFPLIAREGGVLRRSGHTESAADLARMAGQPPVGVLAELVEDDGAPCRLPSALAFARKHGLKITTVAQLIAHRSRHEKLVERVEERTLQTAVGPFRAIVYQNRVDGDRHLALLAGSPAEGDIVPVRIHRSSILEDVFCSAVEDRPRFLWKCLRYIQDRGLGVAIYLGGTESAGERDLFTLSRPVTSPTRESGEGEASRQTRDSWRRVGVGAQILMDLGIHRIELLCLASHHYPGLSGYALEVADVNFLRD